MDELNGYVCFWNGKQLDIKARTSLQAQEKAAVEFQKNTRKKVKSYDITVMLAEKNGKEVVHTPDF